MSRDELRAAITGPVAVAGGAIEPRLVVRLLNEVGDDPYQLPLLQHALMRTWARWEADRAPGEPIGVRHYEAVGTMADALSLHADEPYAELSGERERAIAETLFRALTDVDVGGRGIRRPTPVREVAAIAGVDEEEVIAVVDRFRAPGRTFVTASRVPLDGDAILDLSHEALIRSWTRLGEWVREEARSAAQLRRIATAAREHRQGTGSLWRNPELELATRWRADHRPTAAWAARYDPDFETAASFLDASERDWRRQRRIRRVTAAALGMLLFGLLAAAGLLQRQQVAVAQSLLTAQTERVRGDSIEKVSLLEQRDALQREINLLGDRNPILASFASELQEKNQELRARRATLLIESDSLRQLIPQLRPMVEQLRRSVAEAEESNRWLAEENAQLQQRRAALAAEAEPLQQANRRLRREAETLHERERWLESVATALGLLRPAPTGLALPPPPEPQILSGIRARNGDDDLIEIVRLRVTLDSLRVQHLGLMERIAALQRDNERLQRDVATLQGDVDRLHETAVTLQRQEQQFTQRRDSLEVAGSYLWTTRSRLTEAVDSLDTTVQELRRSVASLERDNPERQARVRELEAKLGLDADGTVMARMVTGVAGAEEDAQRTAVVALTAYQLGLRQGLRDDPVLLGGLLLARDRLDGTPEFERWWDAAEPESLILGPDGRLRVDGRRLRAEVCSRLPAELRPAGC
jgi:uncharacterized coiled-coil DUF342 family protein